MQLPGNGKLEIDVAIADRVIIMGDADHLIQIFVMKYTDDTNTSKNMTPKKNLSKSTPKIFN